MDLISELESINWDFKRYRQTGIDNIHWFPANFIPQIPSILIANLSKTNSIVFDPFCGSGTTLVEAARLGRVGIGIDFNPLACLITKIKTTYVEPILLEQLSKEIALKLNNESSTCSFIPDFPNKERWFHQETLKDLGFIFQIINTEKIDELRNILHVCFSAILKKCCTQRDHYTYVADNMFPKDDTPLIYIDAKKEYMNILSKSIISITNFYNDIENKGFNPSNLLSKFEVENEDVKSFTSVKENSIDLIVTSPPYANVTDYITGNRLSFYWFDFGKIEDLKKNEIGARWKRFRKNAFDDYIDDIRLCCEQLYRFLKKDSFLCIVLGETSSIRKKIDINQKIISILTNKIGFELLSDCIERNIYAKRIRAARGVTKENIYIFQK